MDTVCCILLYLLDAAVVVVEIEFSLRYRDHCINLLISLIIIDVFMAQEHKNAAGSHPLL